MFEYDMDHVTSCNVTQNLIQYITNNDSLSSTEPLNGTKLLGARPSHGDAGSDSPIRGSLPGIHRPAWHGWHGFQVPK